MTEPSGPPAPGVSTKTVARLTVPRLKGMYDVLQESWRTKRYLQDRLMRLFGSYGYQYLETPVLEPTDLFLRKSGGEMASRMYSFTDPGSNLVSLRPEFTSSIMRHYLEISRDTAAPAKVETPARWQYCGPVFRFDGSGLHGITGQSVSDPSGQFTQIGAELIGPSSVLADVELLSLAVSLPAAAGVAGWQLQLADLDVLTSLLTPLELSERSQAFVVQSVPRLREGRSAVDHLLEEGRHLHLVGQTNDEDHLSRAVQGLGDNEARVVLQGLLRWNSNEQYGQRTAGEVVERLLRKIRKPDEEARLRRALELACDLAQVRGQPEAALPAAKAVLGNAGADQSAADRLADVLELLSGRPNIAAHLVLDFGMVRGLAYYNGIIFEVTHPDWPTPLGGGGRYDGLARALGADGPVPALGFAYNVDALMGLTAPSTAFPEAVADAGGTLVVASDPASPDEALKAAQELRDQGGVAELDVGNRSLEQAQAYAVVAGLGQVLLVGADGQRTTHEIA